VVSDEQSRMSRADHGDDRKRVVQDVSGDVYRFKLDASRSRQPVF
jgi:hypothetical protein